ncbi:hypothetical protein [Brevibacillus laterosporus]|uniref:hypothetical protein n=1 Tax=Brevibacillus laterosporus TaxID=1465 RepID=UPI000839D4A2|nr:hypothetical protein [Brevibacillus laterosporus]
MKADEIEKILEHFNILSPERMEADLAFAIQRFEAEQEEIENDPEGYAERRFAEMLEHRVNEKKLGLKQNNDQLHRLFELLIEKDLPRAEQVIPNLGNLTKDMELFNFLCSLFNHDYSRLSQDERNKILNCIGGIFNE